MPMSMTGFGSAEKEITPFGKVSAELRSTNHKFLDTVFHLPNGFLALEDKLKKEIEARLKRGRVTCVINIIPGQSGGVFINKPLLKNYLGTIKNIRDEFGLKDEVQLDTLIHLPGILSLAESKVPKERIWPGLKILVSQALEDLVKMREKEGRALGGYLKNYTRAISHNLKAIRAIFKKVIKDKIKPLKTDEERLSFLKEADIAEEAERLGFHIRNFQNKLAKNSPIGKELDFICQEMQREANTIGAKSVSASISTRVVQIKSLIEKLREQVQNIE